MAVAFPIDVDLLQQLPMLPLRDVVVFPHMVIPLFVGRPRSIKALELAAGADKTILLVTQKNVGKEDPGPDDVYQVGCAASILQMLKLPDGTIKVLVEGRARARIHAVDDAGSGSAFLARVEDMMDVDGAGHELEALRRAVLAQFEQYVKLNKKIPPEIIASLSGIEDAGRLADTIAAHLPLSEAMISGGIFLFSLTYCSNCASPARRRASSS